MKTAKAIQAYALVAGSVITVINSKNFACFAAGVAVMAAIETIVRCW